MARASKDMAELIVLGIFPWCFTPELYAARPDLIQSLADFVRSRPAQPLEAFIRQSDAVLAHDVESQLGLITAPTQITFGRHDPALPHPVRRSAAERHSRIGGGDLRGAALTRRSTKRVEEFNRANARVFATTCGLALRWSGCSVLCGPVLPWPSSRLGLARLGFEAGHAPDRPTRSPTSPACGWGITLIAGDSVRTGVTAILPHGQPIPRPRAGGDPRRQRLRQAARRTQVHELGELETPCCSPARCASGGGRRAGGWMLEQPGMARGALHQPGGGRDQRRRAQRHPHAPDYDRRTCARRWPQTSDGAGGGGSVGAGAGTVASAGRAGSAPSSRVLPRRSAATRWACWCSPTSAANSRSSARRWAAQLGRLPAART